MSDIGAMIMGAIIRRAMEDRDGSDEQPGAPPTQPEEPNTEGGYGSENSAPNSMLNGDEPLLTPVPH